MKILVCISKAPDTTTKISFKNDNKEFNEDGVQYIINPYDEWYALVRGLELKESLGGSVTVVNVGPAANEPVIRKALAIGADDAVRINAEPTDAFFVAQQIAGFAKGESYDLILVGKETINYNGAQVGPMIAELLELPCISIASKLDVEGDTATLNREVEGGHETVKAKLPLVVTCQKGMAEARIPNMRGIMAARTKPLKTVEPVEADKLTNVERYELPPPKSGVKLIEPDNVEELVRLLHEEAKVI